MKDYILTQLGDQWRVQIGDYFSVGYSPNEALINLASELEARLRMAKGVS